MRFFATTPKGMESLLEAELAAIGASGLEPTRAGCGFSGELEVAYRACLWSRVASRVLLPLATFPAPDGDALYAGARAIRWLDHVGPEDTLAVDFALSKAPGSELTHTQYGAQRVKDAIVDQIRDEVGSRPSVDTEAPDVRVNVHLHAGQASLAIDLSGESLHRRGYRGDAALAPLKENLAAAILLLADWPARAARGEPFLDPMCGSGTLPIEAARIAADIAPGISRRRYGFLGWRGHRPELWGPILDEARARAKEKKDLPPILGCDSDQRAVLAAQSNVDRAGLGGMVRIVRKPLAEVRPADVGGRPGIVVVNPPYGERLEVSPSLYADLGDLLRREFPGFTGYIFTGSSEGAKRIGLRATRRHVLWNGALECRLLELPISKQQVQSQPRPRHLLYDPGVVMFLNRVEKNRKHLARWARREGITCYRIYDADLPEYAVAVDLYERAAHVQEYAPPATVDAAKAETRLRAIVESLPEALDLPAEDVFLKVRRRQRGGEQYQRVATRGATREVSEGGYRFLVNLSDYVDTGLFLDHRVLRRMIGELAAGRDFLNLFAYTGTATVYAARGGARSTVSVDLSNTYLDWAGDNFARNGLPSRENARLRADCLDWLNAPERRRYGLIFLAPPTFSNSKGMAHDFDLQRDHPRLLEAAARRLTPDGTLFFSTHFRKFRLDQAALSGLRIEDISHRTIPPDFARDAKAHRSYRITLA